MQKYKKSATPTKSYFNVPQKGHLFELKEQKHKREERFFLPLWFITPDAASIYHCRHAFHNIAYAKDEHLFPFLPYGYGKHLWPYK